MKKRGNKAQSIVEFIVMFGALLFFFVIFMGVIQLNISDQNKEKREAILQTIAIGVRDEISLAAKSSDGYLREFFVPENILGASYEINITENIVVAKTERHNVYYDVFNVTGQVQKGQNTIKKENATIYLN